MSDKLKGLMVTVVAGALLSPPVSAQPAQDRPTGPDQELVAQLHQLGQDEMATARLAEARAVSPRVMAFAVTLRRDHRIANEQLVDYARRKNMNLEVVQRPGDARAHGELARAPLANSRPEEFDYNFASRAVADNQAAIDAATAAQRLARDPELKGLIGVQLVMLSDHQLSAQELLAAIPPPPPRVVQLPAYPEGASRTQTGADEPPPQALRRVSP